MAGLIFCLRAKGRGMKFQKIALMLAPVLMMAGCAKSPEATVQGFYAAIAAGEITEAEAHVSNQVIGMLGPQKLRAKLSSESQRITACAGLDVVEVKLEGKGEVRHGTVVVKYKGSCDTSQTKVALLKEDGKWKIGAGK